MRTTRQPRSTGSAQARSTTTATIGGGPVSAGFRGTTPAEFSRRLEREPSRPCACLQNCARSLVSRLRLKLHRYVRRRFHVVMSRSTGGSRPRPGREGDAAGSLLRKLRGIYLLATSGRVLSCFCLLAARFSSFPGRLPG